MIERLRADLKYSASAPVFSPTSTEFGIGLGMQIGGGPGARQAVCSGQPQAAWEAVSELDGQEGRTGNSQARDEVIRL